MSTYGYYRFAAATPQVRVADVEYNVTAMVKAARDAAGQGAQVLLFPELGVTGCSCGDLFYQPALLLAARKGLARYVAETSRLKLVSIVSLPLVVQDGLYIMAAVVKGGHVLGLVPKSVLPNYREFYEKRQFCAAAQLPIKSLVLPGCGEVAVGTDLIFADDDELTFGVEIGADLWSVIPPSSQLALQGARVIFNPAACDELAGKAAYRRSLVVQQSGRCVAAYVMAGAGVGESTQDVVYGGHCIVADNGRLVAESKRFSRETEIIYADVDIMRLAAARMSESSYHDSRALASLPAPRRIEVGSVAAASDLAYASIPSRPFVPTAEESAARCEEILNIQACGLVKRMEHSHARTMVLGVSGGLDSSLALLVCERACKMMGIPTSTILAVTMPGFGTTGRTYNNAVALIRHIGADFREVNIREACLLHFKDLDFDPSLRTNTYENVQARERTKILMNLANKTGGLVIGTGDLSEIALGWATYNGDHMSMYSVNCSIPKTLIRCLIEHVATRSTEEMAATLRDINATPVSPELLPPAEDGSMEQKTEDILGPYDIHDFFLYHFIKYGATPAKLQALALLAFDGEYSQELIERTLQTFIRRFFTQQFKRTCVPDGPKVGTIALSPRGDWRMPTDACSTVWNMR